MRIRSIFVTGTDTEIGKTHATLALMGALQKKGLRVGGMKPVATLKALDLLAEEQWRRQHLSELIEYFKKGAVKENILVSESHTPIQPLIIGSDKKTVEISRALYECGILISAIRPPTVPENTARLRITLTAAHSMDQVDRLIEALALILKE